MRQENIDFLESCRHLHESLVKGNGVRNIPLQQMIAVMREEFDPAPHVDEGDPDSMVAFIKRLYTLFDEWKAKNITAQNN